MKFTPLFWQQADSRLSIVREIRERFDSLKTDTGADSVQKELLCGRAVFLVTWLETQERLALETGCFDSGPYTQAVNALLGLLRTLGLKRASKKVTNLREYVSEKSA